MIMNHLSQFWRAVSKHPLSAVFYMIYIYFLLRFAQFPLLTVSASNFVPHPELILVFASIFYGYLLALIMASIFIGITLINRRLSKIPMEKRFYRLLVISIIIPLIVFLSIIFW